METLLQTYCFEIEVTCAQAREQDAFVRRMALHLVQYLAVFLAETITGLLQRVLTHPARGLVDETNAALLTQKFWVQAIYNRVVMCLQQAQGSERTGKAETAHWLSEGSLSPV